MTHLLGGIGLVAGLFLTLKQIKPSREAVEKQLETVQSQIQSSNDQALHRLVSDRLADSVEYLASNDVFVRVGAIKILEEVASQSSNHRQPTRELLS